MVVNKTELLGVEWLQMRLYVAVQLLLFFKPVVCESSAIRCMYITLLCTTRLQFF